MNQFPSSSKGSATPYFPSDLADGKVCENKLVEKLRSLGFNPQVNPRRLTFPTPQIRHNCNLPGLWRFSNLRMQTGPDGTANGKCRLRA
jgi:hypothetical protein